MYISPLRQQENKRRDISRSVYLEDRWIAMNHANDQEDEAKKRRKRKRILGWTQSVSSFRRTEQRHVVSPSCRIHACDFCDLQQSMSCDSCRRIASLDFLTNDFDLETRFDFEIIRRRFELEPRCRKRFAAERTFEISRIIEESDRHFDAQ